MGVHIIRQAHRDDVAARVAERIEYKELVGTAQCCGGKEALDNTIGSGSEEAMITPVSLMDRCGRIQHFADAYRKTTAPQMKKLYFRITKLLISEEL